MDVDQKLEELSVLVEEAKAVPLSASCMVNRAVVLDHGSVVHSGAADALARQPALLDDLLGVVRKTGAAHAA